MATPIYLLVIGKGFNEAGMRLTQEERDALWARAEEIDKRAGAKWIIMCDSRWADESTDGWGVLEYPSMDAYLAKVRELEKAGWWRYFDAKSILGTKLEA